MISSGQPVFSPSHAYMHLELKIATGGRKIFNGLKRPHQYFYETVSLHHAIYQSKQEVKKKVSSDEGCAKERLSSSNKKLTHHSILHI